MRAWRALKSMGGAMLRDGVYLLPAGEERDLRLGDVASGIQSAGGVAEVVGILPRDAPQTEAFRQLFDRQPDYLALEEEIHQTDPERTDPTTLKRSLRTLRRRLAEIIASDFFPDETRQQLFQETLTLLENRSARILDPTEPQANDTPIPHQELQQFQGRLWVTRAGLWVDRLASAWLIQRHIDPAARFLWLQSGQTPPEDAVGFDFDGARFTHVRQRVTFETLLAGFALEQDPALVAMGRMIHALDVGGINPEAGGFEALLKGMRRRCTDDHSLLAATLPVLDDYYLFHSNKDHSDG
ncbi:MAG: chromate resistance protein [Magnetococcales bacterium]|nr:chromate resistance protein [Magnetococcales bacterium]